MYGYLDTGTGTDSSSGTGTLGSDETLFGLPWPPMAIHYGGNLSGPQPALGMLTTHFNMAIAKIDSERQTEAWSRSLLQGVKATDDAT